MNIYIVFGLLLFGSYLFGSLNGAKILTKWLLPVLSGEKQDISKLGTGNAGTANISRVYGRKAGIAVLVWDIGRGVLIAVAGKILGLSDSIVLFCGILGMVGHNWPPYFRFQGGKGIAIMGGVLIALHPIILLLALIPSGPLLFLKKQMSGFVPFVGVPVYIGSLLVLQSWKGQEIDWKLVAIGATTLAVIFARRLNADWEGFRGALSKRRSLWYLLIYDRPRNDPPPRLSIVNWLLKLVSSMVQSSNKTQRL